MRVTVSHNKTVDEVKQQVDRGFEKAFAGLPLGAVEIANGHREWVGERMNFSLTARAGFLNVPLKGFVEVEPSQLVVEIDLPSFVGQFLPEEKIKAAVEGQVKGLLT